jgi:hypothetical protein
MRGIAIAALGLMMISACGGRASSQGSTPSCRVYATEYAASGTQQSTTTCAFDRGSLTLSCTTSDGLDAGAPPSEHSDMTWATIDDAVQEDRPIGKHLFVRELFAFSALPNCSYTFTPSYDSSRRVVSEDLESDGSCTTMNTVYSAWDSFGRPTLGTRSGMVFTTQGLPAEPCTGQQITEEFDDEHHMVTVVTSGGTDGANGNPPGNCLDSTSFETFDENGILIAYSVKEPSDSRSTTYTILGTASICRQ